PHAGEENEPYPRGVAPAPFRESELRPAPGQEHDRRAQQWPDVAHQYEPGQPPRDDAESPAADRRDGEEERVSRRIERLAQRGDRPDVSGDVAVDGVEQRRGGSHRDPQDEAKVVWKWQGGAEDDGEARVRPQRGEPVGHAGAG